MSDSDNQKILSYQEITLPKPAELITLPSYMDCHDHSYTQIVIGLKGQAEFEVRGRGNLVGPGQGCVVTACSDHAFGGVINQSDILVLNMPKPTNDDPEMLQKINNLERDHVYFQLDSQIQKLIQMLVQEMRNHPDDLLLSRACNDTVIALMQRHISAFETSRKESRFDLEAIDRYIEQHLSHRLVWLNWPGECFLGKVSSIACLKSRWGLHLINMFSESVSTWLVN
jgi:hypothetical protein